MARADAAETGELDRAVDGRGAPPKRAPTRTLSATVMVAEHLWNLERPAHTAAERGPGSD